MRAAFCSGNFSPQDLALTAELRRGSILFTSFYSSVVLCVDEWRQCGGVSGDALYHFQPCYYKWFDHLGH